MSEEEVLKYLKIARYASNSKDLSISEKEETHRKVSELNSNSSGELETAFQIYKKNATQKIINIEKNIDNLKQKIESADSELARTYQIRINELEHKKIALLCKLEEYIVDDNGDWDSFKKKFNYELKSFEEELEDFVGNFIQK